MKSSVLKEAEQNVIMTARLFVENELALEQLESPLPNPLYPMLITSVAVLEHTRNSRRRKVPIKQID